MTSPHSYPYPDFLDLSSMFSEEQRIVMHSVREFVEKEVAPDIAEHFAEGEFPVHIIPKLGAMGLLGADLKGEGLPGLDSIAYGIIMRELERCDSGIRSFVTVLTSLVMYPILTYGSEEQKKEWLPKLASGEAVGCFGLTEEQGGSDPGAMRTRAEWKKDHFLLNGSKMWITNGSIADVALVWADTKDGIRGFLVPTTTKGMSTKKMTGKLSLRASITSELYFDDVELPPSAMLPKADGLKAALKCLNHARYGIAWGSIGAAEDCFSEAAAYVQDRVTFGRTLASNQLVQSKLATMLSLITQAQLLAYRVGQLMDEDRGHFSHVSMAKQNNVKMALEVARTCRGMLGANGIMLEYRSMRHMCNLESVSTYEGPNDIHLLIMGREITGVSAL